jgi:hypothetical protein
MEVLLEVLLQFVGEFILQIAAEVLFELGIRSLGAPFKTAPNPYFATIGYVLFGAIAGALSLWALPTLFIHSPTGRVVNAIFTPLVAGASMAAIGAWRTARGQRTILLDRFAYGFLFALVMALVRLRFGN